MELYNQILHVLEVHGISYKKYSHDPILNYGDAEKEKWRHNWSWVESKNVFMTDKKWWYYLFVTIQWVRVDFEKLKSLTWNKLSLASEDDVKKYSHCTPWCVSPLLLNLAITTFVDTDIFKYDSYLFSPWIPTETIELNPKDLRIIFESQKNTHFL